MRLLNFRKTTARNLFTKIFGNVGKRRTATGKYRRGKWAPHRFKLQMIRRAHQGWRNRTFGSLQALKIRLKYGRRKTIPQLRR